LPRLNDKEYDKECENNM